VPKGNYTSGWLILDKDDPTIIKQKSSQHLVRSGPPPPPLPTARGRGPS
jgi:hypothetical protein